MLGECRFNLNLLKRKLKKSSKSGKIIYTQLQLLHLSFSKLQFLKHTNFIFQTICFSTEFLLVPFFSMTHIINVKKMVSNVLYILKFRIQFKNTNGFF